MTTTDDSLDVQVVREPLTYELSAPHSYFRDLVLSLREDGNAKSAAAKRLASHMVQMRTLLAERETAARARAATGGIELRANPSRLDGQGGFAAPPLWLIDHAATAPRPGRVLANLIPGFPLPSGVAEVAVPRLSTGTQVNATADGAAVPGQDIVDAAATSPVATFAGQCDAALQLLEQSPGGAFLDAVIFADLASDYDFKLERMLINGTGTGAEFLGILNVPTGAGLASAVTYTDASPTALEMVPFLGQAAAQLGNARGLPPEVWLLRTSRRAWISSAAWPSSGNWLGYLPVDDNAIPATLGGTPGTQDAIVACRPSDMLLLESAPRFRVDRESLSGTLGVRLQMVGSAAAFVARRPTAIATVRGTGMAVQPGF